MSGAALSDYGQRILEERRRLLGALVQHLTGEQPETEQHYELVEASMAATQYHQFVDVAPRVVDELVDRLGERLDEHAQFGKQRALQLLRARLLETPVKSSQYDFQHRLLAFLYAASRAPLSTHYAWGPLLESLEEQARNAAVGPPTYLSDASSAGSWAEEGGLYSPGSQLSEWSDEGAGEAGLGSLEEDEAGRAELGPPQAAGVVAAAALAASRCDSSAAVEAEAVEAGSAAHAAAAAGSLAQLFPPSIRQVPRRETPYTRTSLSVWLASKQSGGQPARVLQPALCFHERELVQQVLHMLKGVATPGPAFQLDPVRGAYQPRPGVHLHCSSLGSARAVLARFARCASALRRAQTFCAAVARGGRPGSEPPGQLEGAALGGALGGAQQQLQEQREQRQAADGLPRREGAEQLLFTLPTVAAFAAAVAEEEQALQQQVLVLEAACASGALSSLLQLQQRTASLAEQAELLALLLRRCCAWRSSAADSATGLLSTLHDTLQHHLLLARSQGGTLAAMLLRVFAASCRPLLGTLHKWLYGGLLDDPFEEFFVMRAPGPEVPTDSPSFWSAAFVLRPAKPASLAAATAPAAARSAAAPPAAPSFLAPLAGSILAAGKSMLLLQAYSSWRLAAAAAGSAGAAALTARQHLASSLGGDGADEGPPSPAKRRLSEFGALGFALAAEPGRGRQQAYQRHAPRGAIAHAPPLSAEATAGAQERWGGGQDEDDGVGTEPPQLHRQLLEGLEAQLEEKLASAKQLKQQQQLEAVMRLEAAGYGGGSSGSDASDAGSGRIVCGDWQHAAAASSDHALLLPTQDMLPPLPQVPATPDGLPVASRATISPAAVDDADSPAVVAAARQFAGAGAGAADGASGSRRSCSSNASQELPIAERMRQAAGARAAQAAGTAAAQLPFLIIPPAPLEACLAAASDKQAERAAGSSAGTLQAEREQAPVGTWPDAAVQFDSHSWQEWYQQTAAALSRQLHVIECPGLLVGSSSSRDGPGRRSGRQHRLPPGSFGVPLGLPTGCSGSACEQLWGEGSPRGGLGRSRGGDAAQQRRQQPGMAAEAPPLGVLLECSMMQPIQAQVDAVGGALCAALLRRGLLRQIAAMREVYLLSSPLLEPFVAFLLRRISTATGGLDRVSEFELNAALQDALAAGAAGAAGGGVALRAAALILSPSKEAQQAQQAIPQRVHALARLRLRVEPGWPLSLLVGEEMLAQYNRVLVLLLQLRWVRQSLQSVRYQGWKAGRRGSQGPAARDALQHQMMHLVDSVRQYMSDRVVAAGAWLEQAVAACGSLDAMHSCRAKYLRAVTRYCLLSNEGAARLVHEGILHLLNACLQYCALHRQQDAVAAALAQLAAAQQQQQHGKVARGAASGDDAEDDGGAGAAEAAGQQEHEALAGLQWAGRRAELARRDGEVRAALGTLRRDWSNRQRLLLRVLAAKAAEAGSHADELRQLLGALDFSRHYEASMA